MAKDKWFNLTDTASGGATILQIDIYDEIGFYGIKAKDFINQVNAKEFTSIDLHISSPGGSVIEGWHIYNFLKSLKVPITVYVDSLAASMASIIAMVGDEIVMPFNAMLMLHLPWTMTIGNEDDLRKDIALLEKMKDSSIKAYKENTAMSYEDIEQMLRDETWLTATEASEIFNNVTVIEAKEMVASLNRIKGSAIFSQFSEVPTSLLEETEPEEETEDVSRETGSGLENSTDTTTQGESEISTEEEPDSTDTVPNGEGEGRETAETDAETAQMDVEASEIGETDIEPDKETESMETDEQALTDGTSSATDTVAWEEGYDTGIADGVAKGMAKGAEAIRNGLQEIQKRDATISELTDSLATINAENDKIKKEFSKQIAKLENEAKRYQERLGRLNVALAYTEDSDKPLTWSDAIKTIQERDGLDYDRAFMRAKKEYSALYEQIRN